MTTTQSIDSALAGTGAAIADFLSGSATPAEARVRLEAVFARFEKACRARAASGQKVNSSLFGAVSAEGFAEFQELHVKHHLAQLPGAA